MVFILTNFLWLGVSLLFYFTSSPVLILITYAAMGFLQSPAYTDLDSWILKSVDNNFSKYGSIRSMGSLGFAVYMLLFGMLVSSRGYAVMPVFLSFFIAVSVITALTVPETQTELHTVTVARITPSDIKNLVLHKSYLFLLIILFFAGYSSTALQQNKILLWEYLKAPISYQGYDNFFSAIFQFPFIFLTSFFSRIPAKARLASGIFLTFVMFIMVFFARTPQLVVAGSVMGGIGYGLLLPSMREIIVTSAAEKLRTTAQGLGDAVYGNLSGVIGCFVSGFVVDSFGIKTFLLICTVVFLIPVVLAFSALVPHKQKA